MTKQLYLEAIDALRQRVEAMGEGEDFPVLDMLAEEIVKALARFNVAERAESATDTATPGTQAEPPADDLRPETPETWHTFATIRPESERAAWWRETFGGDRCPVKSIIPARASLPGKPDALVYEMDLAALTPEMRERLVQSIAKRFEQDPAFVEANLDREGCPVLADDVAVTTTKVGLLLPDAEGDAWDWDGVTAVGGDDWTDDEEDPDDWEDDDLFKGGDWDPDDEGDLWEDDPDFAPEYIGDDDGEDDESGL